MIYDLNTVVSETCLLHLFYPYIYLLRTSIMVSSNLEKNQ